MFAYMKTTFLDFQIIQNKMKLDIIIKGNIIDNEDLLYTNISVTNISFLKQTDSLIRYPQTPKCNMFLIVGKYFLFIYF